MLSLTIQERLRQFRENHGANWYRLINSPMFIEAMQLAEDMGPLGQLKELSTEKVLEIGVPIAAQIRGFRWCRENLVQLVTPERAPQDTPATYEPEEELLSPEEQPSAKPKANRKKK